MRHLVRALLLVAVVMASVAAVRAPRLRVVVGEAGTVTRINSELRWPAGSLIELAGPIEIVDGGVLRLAAGTRVEAALGAYILVSRDGSIEASGSLYRPIELTCRVTTRYPGCWGGLIIQGNARINFGTTTSPAGERSGAAGCREAIDPLAPAQSFGACNDADNSGFIRYLRIQYAERGLQLQAVGSGTSIQYVQANRSRAEGLLVVGGEARVRELFLTANGTGLRWTGGWRGQAQAIVIQQDVANFRAGLVGQNAFTAGGDPDLSPRSAPTIYNLTMLAQSLPTNPTHSAARAILLERGTAGTLRNAFLYAPHLALDIEGNSTCQQLNDGALSLANFVTAGAGALGLGATPATCTLSEADVLSNASASNLVLASANGQLRSENDLLLPDLRPVFNSSLALATASAPPSGGFLTGLTFVGAVQPSSTPGFIPWFSGWTDPAPEPAPIPAGTVTGFVRSPFRGFLAGVTVREASSGQSGVTSATGAFTLAVPVGTVLLEVDALPEECSSPLARAAIVSPGAATNVELIVDCWPFAAATRLAPGGDFMCAIAEQGPHCWGENGRGQLGIGSTSDMLLPVTVTGGFTSITAGAAHACGRTPAALVRCWGAGDQGQLGDAATVDRLSPVNVAGGHNFLAVTAGDQHTCGVKTDGSIWCWGANSSGQLGTGTTVSASAPVQVNSSVLFASVDAGAQHTCALSRAGAAYCWGNGVGGEIGDGATMMRLTPAAVATTERFAALTVGGSHACGTTGDGVILCWGNNLNGALGDGTNLPRTSPVSVMTANPLRLVSTGGNHTCAATLLSLAQCWGANTFGQLGIGNFTSSTVPVSASLATNMRLLASGPDYTCGITSGAVTGTDGTIIVVSSVALLCWGNNSGGQFGTGDLISSRSPVGAAFGITFR